VHDDSLRSYLLYVPAAYDGQEEWPLVINFHGFSSSAGGQMGLSQMNSVADTANYLLAYPQGLMVNNPVAGTRGPGWNLGGPVGNRRIALLSDNDDVDFGLELINHVKTDYLVDPSRMHVTGWSMGAGMAYEMACAHADMIASLAAVAEQMDDGLLESCVPGAMSFLQIHGTADPIVSFDAFAGGGIIFSPAPATASKFATIHSCSDSTETEIADSVAGDSSTVTLIEYTGCDDETEVLFYRVNNGGHSWPGGGALPPFLGAVNQDINASAEILSFFKRNPYPNLTTGVIAYNSESSPGTFQLNQNYPNPFNPSTTINYYLPSASDVELRIYNQLGREVRTLVKMRQSTGAHQVHWDGRDGSSNLVASGLYFYRLNAGSFVETRKMMLLR
jgi:polyhydroxybutyrate depolymerase